MKRSLTEEELKILATADVDLVKPTQFFCFDLEDFSSKMKNGERWQQLIQCHLYFEHVIDHLLRDALKSPEAITLSGMGFSQRLDLVQAMDILPKNLIAPIRLIVKMRNNVAHNLAFEIDDQKINDLKNCVPKTLRKAIFLESGSVQDHIEFSEILRVILFTIEINRQSLNADRILARKAEIRLRAVLDKDPRAVYVK
jgi:hypothetical protein